MKKTWAFVLISLTFLLLLSIAVFIVNNILSLSALLGRLSPELGTASLVLLLGLTAICFALLAGIYLRRQKTLVPPVNPTPEEDRIYCERLTRRLRSNRHLADEDFGVCSAEDVCRLIGALDVLTEREIRKSAKRVFLSTSVSQNGRLDSILVFYQIVVLIWKVSGIYNQRPYPYELWKIYSNVLATSIISFGMEESDLKEQVAAIVSPLFANSLLDRIPVIQTFSKVFTQSILNGTANACLVCRVGITARNYLGLRVRRDAASSQRPTVEAVSMLNAIVAESLPRVLAALGGSFRNITMQGARKASDSLMTTAGGIAQGFAGAGRTVRRTGAGAYRTTVKGVKKFGTGAVEGGRAVFGRLRQSGEKFYSELSGRKKK